jgi:uncharacterized membrane protein
MITSFVIGLAFVLIGAVLMKYPPNHINSNLGYRTPYAMKNKETWNDGNRFFGKTLCIGGIIYMLFSVLLRNMYSNNLSLNMKVSLLGLLTIAIACILLTEIHLRMKFDRAGSKRIHN